MNLLSSYIKAVRRLDAIQHPIPISPLVCRDGFQFSVQASGLHYCTPRSDNPHEWATFEIGFCNTPEPMFQIDGVDELIYDNVPHDLIMKVIEKHKGCLVLEKYKERNANPVT